MSSSSNSNERSPFDSLCQDLSSCSDSESVDSLVAEADRCNSDFVRGGLTSAHLDPFASRNWKSVLSWIAFHPDEVSTLVDREGHTSLHQACLFRAPLDVIGAMIFAASELASFHNDVGELPLHWAVRLTLSLDVLTILLEAYPRSGFAEDNEGITPLSLLWDRHDDALVDAHRVYGRERVTSSITWKRMMLLVGGFVGESDHAGFPLHAIVQTPCESSFLMFATQVCRDEMCQCDPRGCLPLHLACDAPNACHSLSIVLSAYPGAACVADAEGRLPLEIAIASGKKWEDGVEMIFLANPAAVLHQDPNTHLYPFMQGATLADPCLSTIYALLRANPDLMGINMSTLLASRTC